MHTTTLAELYEQHRGKVSDKWSLYLNEYERLLRPYAHRPISLLEIGIQNGGSLEIWARYFEHAERIVGCDINPACARLRYGDRRVAVVVGDADTPAAEAEIAAHGNRFDLIIDDGSHRSGDIIRTFARYFERLVDDGLFIVEDLHCSYFGAFEGGLFDPASSMSFFKRLADLPNHEHWGVTEPRKAVLASFMRDHGFDMDEELLSHVHSVEFVNSLCVVRKAQPSANVLGPRFIAGQEELVVSGHLKYHHLAAPTVDERNNPWSRVDPLPEDERVSVQAELARLREVESNSQAQARRIEALAEALAERDAAHAQLAQRFDDGQSQLAALTSRLIDADRHSADQGRQMNELRQQWSEAMASRSWRMTRWLRWLERALARSAT